MAIQKITVEIMGGLGNQLFQIFTLISYAISNKRIFYFENKTISFGTRKTYYCDNFLFKLKSFKKNYNEQIFVYKEPFHHYNDIPIMDAIMENIKLHGYFQSYKYFDCNISKIIKMIDFEGTQKKIKYKLDNQELDNYVSLHFRVGDYVNLQQYHPLMSVEYYRKALEQLKFDTNNEEWNILYFCEENDISYVEDKIDHLKRSFPKMRFSKIDSKFDDWEQMVCMTLCKHNIIANSTFSWWGAYLNSWSDKIVCYPGLWFGPSANHNTEDLCPDNWVEVNTV